MPNQCIHCSSIYDDGSRETTVGCSKCGSKFFFYMTADKMLKIQQARGETFSNAPAAPLGELTAEDKQNMEQDVREIVGIKEIDAPVILDFESVTVTSPGKYILDVPNLFNKNRPLVYKLEDGKYVIDLSSAIK
ncbi:MAG: OapC/ArvC family zinc-ribbon domain-containing protein [Candidatus Pacearchaeota archaeon]